MRPASSTWVRTHTQTRASGLTCSDRIALLRIMRRTPRCGERNNTLYPPVHMIWNQLNRIPTAYLCFAGRPGGCFTSIMPKNFSPPSVALLRILVLAIGAVWLLATPRSLAYAEAGGPALDPFFHGSRAGDPIFSIEGGTAVMVDKLTCEACNTNGVALGALFALRGGRMLTNRLGLAVELQAVGAELEVHVDETGYLAGTKKAIQWSYLISAQCRISRQFQVRTGAGVSKVSYHYEDSYKTIVDNIGIGGTVSAALVYEYLSARQFSLDISGYVSHTSFGAGNGSINFAGLAIGLSIH